MSNYETDFDALNAAAVQELPDWKRQYSLSVDSYTPMRSEEEMSADVEPEDVRHDD